MPPRRRRAAAAVAPSFDHALLKLQAIVPQLLELTSHKLGLPGVAPVAACEARPLPFLVSIMLEVHEAAGNWSLQDRQRFLDDERLQLALLHLVTVGVHWALEEVWGATQQHDSKLVAELYLCVTAIMVMWRFVRLFFGDGQLLPLELCSALLRMQLLHAGAQQLAAAAERSRRPLPPNEMAATTIPIICALPKVLLAALTPQQAVDTGSAALLAALRTQLAEALQSSRILEHSAQALLTMASRQDLKPYTLMHLRDATTGLHDAYRVAQVAIKGPDPPLHQATSALLQALYPPGAVHLLLGMGVLALRHFDGGTAHGLDEQVWRRLFPSDLGGDPGTRPPAEAGKCAAVLVRRMLEALVRIEADGVTLHAMQPEGAAIGLLLRTARMAAGRLQAPQLPHDPHQLLLPRTGLARLLYSALHSAWYALRAERPCASGGSRWVEAWGLLLRSLADALQQRDAEHATGHQDLGTMLSLYLENPAQGDRDPLSPHPGLLAGLSAGLLPFLERLLRRAGEESVGPASAVLDAAEPVAWPWLALLANGSPQQGAALVVTLRKLLQRMLGWFVGGGGGCISLFLPSMRAACCILSGARDAVAAHRRRVCGAAGGAVQGGPAVGAAASATAAATATAAVALPPPLPQPAAVAAQPTAPAPAHPPAELRPASAPAPAPAALQPLPPAVAYAVLQLMPALAAVLSSDESTPTGAGLTQEVLQTLLGAWDATTSWVRLLMAGMPLRATPGPGGQAGAVVAEPAAGGGVGVPGGAGAREGAAAGGHAGADGAHWRRLLLRMGVVRVAGAALRFAELVARVDRTSGAASEAVGRALALACEVAGVFPEELHAAVAAASDPGAAPAGGAQPGGSRSAGGDARAAESHSGAGASAGVGGGGGGGEAVWPLLPLLPYLQVSGQHEAVRRAEQLAGHLRRGAAVGALPECLCAAQQQEDPLPLPPLAEALALLRTCSNPACDVLEGDSEADARLRPCRRCGAAWYCCGACQLAHWRGGHQEACAGAGGGGGQAAGAGA